MKINKDYLIYFVFICIIVCFGFFNYKLYKKTNMQVMQIEQIEEKQNNSVSVIHYEQKIESLSKLNKELYDSLEIYKKQIDYLVQFKYEKKYESGKIETDSINEIVHDKDSVVKTFEYENTTDTISYNLKIGTSEKPQWYSLDFKISDKFTIVNKNFDEYNKLDIKSDGSGKIDDITVLKKKEKKNIFDNISIGPSVTMGYNFAMKEPEFIVGFSITYDIKDLIWKKKD